MSGPLLCLRLAQRAHPQGHLLSSAVLLKALPRDSGDTAHVSLPQFTNPNQHMIFWSFSPEDS